MDPHRPGQCATFARLGDEAHRFAPATVATAEADLRRFRAERGTG